VVLKLDGTVESEILLPGEQDEGFCLDGDGDLWVADDRAKSLLRFNGALQAMRASLAAEEEPSVPSPGPAEARPEGQPAEKES
jgi:hypothetical protein